MENISSSKNGLNQIYDEILFIREHCPASTLLLVLLVLNWEPPVNFWQTGSDDGPLVCTDFQSNPHGKIRAFPYVLMTFLSCWMSKCLPYQECGLIGVN